MVVAENAVDDPNKQSKVESHYDLGVLFVHGIGQQRRGETLVEVGDTLVSWLRRWMVEGYRAKERKRVEAAEQAWKKAEAEEAEKKKATAAHNPTQPPTTTAEKKEDAVQEGETLPQDAGEKPGQSTSNSTIDPIPDLKEEQVVQVRETILKAAGEAPAHSALSLNIPDRQERTWLLAESWWAENFFEPGFFPLLQWAFQVLPWAMYSHFGVQARRIYESVVNTMAQFARSRYYNPEKAQRFGWLRKLLLSKWVWFVLFFPLYLIIQVIYSSLAVLLIIILLPGILLLSVLTLIPISFIQSLAGQLQQILSAFIGDSYIFLTSPLQAASITRQVHHDLDWLAQRCSHVTVVAHSQGAAVVVEMLREGLSPHLKSKPFQLITYGSGLKKLDDLRALQQSNGLWRAYLSLFTFFGVVILLWGLLTGPNRVQTNIILTLMVIGGILFILSVTEETSHTTLDIERVNPEVLFGAKTTWFDYFASHDPVPNGPLYDTPEDISLYTKEVHNRGSLLFDHTTYWENLDGFVGLIADTLMRFDDSAFGEIYPGDDERMIKALSQRRQRVNALLWTRRAAIGVLGLLLFVHWQNLAAIGEKAQDLLQIVESYPLLSWIGSMLQNIDWAGPSLVGGITLALIVFLGYQLLYLIWWYTWEYLDTQAFFRRGTYDYFGPTVFFSLAIGVAVLVCMQVYIDWPQRSGMFINIVVHYLGFYALLPTGVYLAGCFFIEKFYSHNSFQEAGKKGLSGAIVTGVLGLIYASWLIVHNQASTDISSLRGQFLPEILWIIGGVIVVVFIVTILPQYVREWQNRKSSRKRSNP